jgi:hypothetical protein
VDKVQEGDQAEKEKQKLFLLLNGILGISLDPAKIVGISSGKFIIDIPYHLSYELKAQALNNNPKLWEAGIKGLHFEGDKHNILLQDPQLIAASQKGKGTQQSATPSKPALPKAKPKLSLIIGGLLIPLICIVVLFGVYLFSTWDPGSRPPIVPSTRTNAPNTLLPDPPTLTSTPFLEPPPIIEPPTITPTFTPSPTATRTPTITITITPMPASISGKVWDDANGDGIDSIESSLAGIPISLGLGSCNSSGFKDITSTAFNLSSPNINYSFTELAAGTYCVSVDIEEKCNESPDARTLTTPKMHTITLLPGEHESVSFGSKEEICVD